MRAGWKITRTLAAALLIWAGCSLETSPLGPTDGGMDAARPDAGEDDAGRDGGEEPDGGSCTVTADCSGSDMCCGGQCVVAGCDDGNPCTDDACGPSGCEHVANTDTCDDGVFCNGADTCADESCSSHAGDPCPGASVCNEDANTCEGCSDDDDCPENIPGGWSGCSDFGGTCDESGTQTRTITSYSCASGTCESSTSTDSRPCMRNTDDIPCGDPTLGGWSACENDTDACSTSGEQQRSVTQPVCMSGSCSGSTSTTETRSCTRDPAGDPCDDGDECTTGDSCTGGSCVGSGTLDCDDGNVCTADSCEPSSGCVHDPVSGSCNAGGDGCTPDRCVDGMCVSKCDDGDPCTDDRCTGVTCHNDPIGGCTSG